MILVLGSGGLLGSTICRLHPKDAVGYSSNELNVYDQDKVRTILETIGPDVIINCAGVVPNSPRQGQMHYVNAEFPRWLEETCTSLGIRLVHMSTDCVFDGVGGFDKAQTYNERSLVNPDTEYGRTKAEGEFVRSPHLVVRTSFVGLPDPKGHGLLAWLERHAGESVSGWTNHLWNGWTVDLLADLLVEIAYRPRIWGIRHVCGEVISKYTLLNVINHIYGFDCHIRREEAKKAVNRSLSTIHSDVEQFYPILYTKSFKVMAQWMKERSANV